MTNPQITEERLREIEAGCDYHPVPELVAEIRRLKFGMSQIHAISQIHAMLSELLPSPEHEHLRNRVCQLEAEITVAMETGQRQAVEQCMEIAEGYVDWDGASIAVHAVATGIAADIREAFADVLK